MKTGKRYAEAMKNVDRAALYDVADAISIVKKNASAKFDETVAPSTVQRPSPARYGHNPVPEHPAYSSWSVG